MTYSERKYWNPYVETLPRDKITELQLKNLRKLIRYSKENSVFYMEKYSGIEPEDVKSLEDVRKLPLVDKEDLRTAQEGKDPFPFGEILGVSPEEVSAFRQTSGTTGTPVYVPESWESWQWRVEVWCHSLWMAGFRESDRIFIPFGYNVYVAFWEGHYAAEKVGCTVIPGGALDTMGRLNKILETRPTGIFNTPTYGLHMAEVAKKIGINPRDTSIKRMICAGEPLPDATRIKLEDIWGADVYNNIGGTEPCAWGQSCVEKKGIHTMEPFFLVEILDMKTLSREVVEGELGIVVVTPLGRHSFPLIRFNTQDVVRKGKGQCACGRTSTMIDEVAGRADDLRKVRGVLFNPVSVEEVIRGEFPEVCEYEINVENKGVMDVISLKVECHEEIGDQITEILLNRISERLKIKTNLTFRMLHVNSGELPRYDLKSKRFKDLRR